METEETRALEARWWMFVVRGVAAIVFGIFAFAMPGISLFALVVLYGAYALVDGVFSLVTAARRGHAGERWGWFMFEGLLGIGAAFVAFSWPAITAVVMLAVIAAWAILTGISAVAAAIRVRKHVKGEWMLAVSGVLSIVFGALLLVDPSVGALAVMWMIGAWAIAFGVLLVGLGVRLHGHRTVGEPAGVATPA